MTAIDDAMARDMKSEVRQGWTRESEGWIKHAALMAVWTRDAVDRVVRAAKPASGVRALDVASAAGVTALALAKAVEPGGSVVGVDLVPEMARGAERIARERAVTNVTFREADAEALPFGDATFDVVTCLHGVMFFPRPEKALAEFRRVLRPGGRASLLAWGPRERNPFFMTVGGPFMRRMPPAAMAEGPEDAPEPFRFAASGKLSKVLYSAGFDDVAEETIEVVWDFPGTPETFVSAVQEISSSLFDWFRAELSSADLDAAAADLLADARQRYQDGKVRFTAAMVLATGARPR